MRQAAALFVGSLLLASNLQGSTQTAVSKSGYSLVVTGDVPHSLRFSLADLKKLGSTQAVLTEHDGKAHRFVGVPLIDVLAKAGLPVGHKVRAKALATYLLFGAPDGYKVVMGMGEVEPVISGRKIILAYLVDGKPLNAKLGPVRLVVDHDQEPSRSIRMVASIKVVQLRK